MSEWVEIPAHRVLLITHEEFCDDFIRVNAEGQTPPPGEACYRVIRKRDNKVFRIADFQPYHCVERNEIALKEI